MKNVLIINQKGGVGKTLIADELAFAFEREQIPYNFIDMDGQGSPCHETATCDDAVVQIIDTAGALNENMDEWINHSDFVIVPTTMGPKEMAPLERMIKLLAKYEDKKPVLYVFNRWNRFSISRDFIEWFNTMHPDKRTTSVSDTVAFAQAHAQNKSICDLSSRNSGAKEIEHIYSCIKYELNIKDGRNA